MSTQENRVARRVRLRLPGRARPRLWVAAAVVLAPVGLLNLWMWFVVGHMGTNWDELEAYRSATNPFLWVLALSAALIVTSAIGALVLQLHRHPVRLVTGLAAVSVITTTAWLALDAALMLGLRFGLLE